VTQVVERNEYELPFWLEGRTTAAVAAITALLILLGAPLAPRSLFVLLFTCYVPGAVVVRNFLPAIARQSGPRLFVSIVVSLAITVGVSELMVLARQWHPTSAVLLLAMLAIGDTVWKETR
jgi:uncharacterized membrane protein